MSFAFDRSVHEARLSNASSSDDVAHFIVWLLLY